MRAPWLLASETFTLNVECIDVTPFGEHSHLLALSLLIRETGRGGPVLDPELWINVFKMFANGRGTDSENHSDLGVCFSSGEPTEHLPLTRSQRLIGMTIASDR